MDSSDCPPTMEPFPLVPPSSEEEVSLFSYLPPELWVTVISFCPISSFFSLASTSPKFYSLLSNPSVQRSYLGLGCTFIQRCGYYATYYAYQRDSLFVGPYLKVYSNNNSKVGFYIDGNKVGTWYRYQKDNRTIICQTKYDNGSYKIWNFFGMLDREGESIGPTTRKEIEYYYSNLLLARKITFLRDKSNSSRRISGPYCSYENGIIADEGYLECRNGALNDASFIGLRKLYNRDGSVYQEYNYVDGLLDGPFKINREDGSPYIEGTIELISGLPKINGTLVVHNHDGTVAVIPYRDGKKHGIARVCDIGGACLFRGEFDHDMRIGSWCGVLGYYSSIMISLRGLEDSGLNHIISTISFSDITSLGLEHLPLHTSSKVQIDFSADEKHGYFLVFYPSGKPYIVGNFKSNNLHGSWKHYSTNRDILLSSYYYDGKPIDKWIYRTSSGILFKREHYLDGIVITKLYDDDGRLTDKLIYSNVGSVLSLLYSKIYCNGGRGDTFFNGQKVSDNEYMDYD